MIDDIGSAIVGALAVDPSKSKTKRVYISISVALLFSLVAIIEELFYGQRLRTWDLMDFGVLIALSIGMGTIMYIAMSLYAWKKNK